MLQVVKGTYKNSLIILDEKPDVKSDSKVLVTFLNDSPSEEKSPIDLLKKSAVVFGSLKGKITLPDDFDEPFEDLKDYMY